MTQYIREGGKSFHANRGRYINPYRPGSNEFNDFERGWSQELKRSPEQTQGNYPATKNALRRGDAALPELVPAKSNKEMPDDIYVRLATRALERLRNDSSYRPPQFRLGTNVYYVRIETDDMPLWKIGVTFNKLNSRYCIADRRIIVDIHSWHYASREEAEAIEREILTEFADYKYEGGRVLRSGGDGELFTRDVLKLDNQDDFRAMSRKERLGLT
jgi:hypothetical protein